MINMIICFAITCIYLQSFIFLSHKYHAGYQQIRNDGPKSHILTKTKTPTSGGLILIGLIFACFNNLLLAQLMLAFGIIGIADDYLKMIYPQTNKLINMKIAYSICFAISFLAWFLAYKINAWFLLIFFCLILINSTNTRGLNIKNKLMLQIIAAGIYVFQSNITPLLLAIFSIIFIVGVANSVNISDGLDGLITVPLILAFTFYACKFQSNIALISIITLSAFLIFNFYPAKIFMGDVGSLGFGALLAGLAIETNTIFALIPLGLIFIINILSVILQIFSYKIYKKRIFLMAPIHHHFECKGYNEKQIVFTAWSMQAFLTIITLMFY